MLPRRLRPLDAGGQRGILYYTIIYYTILILVLILILILILILLRRQRRGETEHGVDSIVGCAQCVDSDSKRPTAYHP